MSADVPPDLKNADALDPTLIEQARASAARMAAGLRRDHAPADEPAHVYLADTAP